MKNLHFKSNAKLIISPEGHILYSLWYCINYALYRFIIEVKNDNEIKYKW